MKFAYVPRYFSPTYYYKRSNTELEAARQVEAHLKYAASAVRRQVLFPFGTAFFDEGLYAAGDVETASMRSLRRGAHKDCDALIVHFRFASQALRGEDDAIIEIAKHFPGPKALLIDSDEADFMKPDRVLDPYDIVFKREPFVDRERYSLSNENRAKIRPTMLACPYYRHSRYGFARRRRYDAALQAPCTFDGADVFFIGKTSQARETVMRRLKKERRIDVSGGLMPRKGLPFDPELRGTPMPPVNFIGKIKSSKISLAIEGHGQFSFRPLEIWTAGGFLMANASLKELDLPLPMEDGENYVAFTTPDDLVEKIEHYIARPDDIRRIAKAGEEMFKTAYNPTYHAKDIRAAFGR